jgi:hypothetical protein
VRGDADRAWHHASITEEGDVGSGQTVLRWLGLILFVGTGFFYAVAGLVAPLIGVTLLWVIWVGLAVLLIRWWRGSAWKVFAVPYVAMAVWGAVLYFGDAVLGWTA